MSSELRSHPAGTDAKSWSMFVAASMVFFALTGFFAHRKLLWFDELFTVFIAKQPDLARFLDAIRHGGDTLPPAIHLLTRASIAIFGEHHVVFRLPSMLGYWLMLVCVYAFVRFRSSRVAAWSAALVPLATNTYWYAYEARPYGLLLGLSALALVAWQRAATARRNRWRVVLWAAVVAAFLTHWYAAVLAGILLVVELVRRAETRDRRADAIAALALAILTAAPIVYPFLSSGVALRGLIAPPSASTFTFHAYDLLIGGFAPFALCLLAIAASRTQSRLRPSNPVPVSEVAAAVAFLLVPFMSLVIAWAAGSQLLPRYAVTGVIGAALLVGYAADAVASTRSRSLAWTAVIACSVAANLAIEKLRLPDRSALAARTGDFAILAQIDDLPPSEVVVVPDGLAFIRLAYYSPELAPRLVHLVDKTSLGSVALSRLAAYAPLNCGEFDPFLARTPVFGVYNVGFESPFMAALAARGASFSLASAGSDGPEYNSVFQVRMDPHIGAGAAAR